MRILSAEFVTSAAAGGSATGVPRDRLPQIALVGRSNVGKSSLINALCRQDVARTSAAPGKTRLANVYRVHVEDGRRRGLYLVDLPGYGYARGGEASANELAGVAAVYFQSRRSEPGSRTPDSGRVLLLVDSRHPGLDADVRAARWLATLGEPWHVVATKVDKLSRAERTRNLRDLERAFGQPALPVSAATGEGLDALWALIVRGGRKKNETEETQ